MPGTEPPRPSRQLRLTGPEARRLLALLRGDLGDDDRPLFVKLRAFAAKFASRDPVADKDGFERRSRLIAAGTDSAERRHGRVK